MRTQTVTPSQLAFLLQRRVGDCKRMIEKITGDENTLMIPVFTFEKHYSHYPISEKIESIENDYLKKGSTRGFIMSYPQVKIDASKTPINKLCIPVVIKSFLSDSQIEEILSYWNVRYKNYNIIFS